MLVTAADFAPPPSAENLRATKAKPYRNKPKQSETDNHATTIIINDDALQLATNRVAPAAARSHLRRTPACGRFPLRLHRSAYTIPVHPSGTVVLAARAVTAVAGFIAVATGTAATACMAVHSGFKQLIAVTVAVAFLAAATIITDYKARLFDIA